jgi:hypothetical protein
MRFAPFPNVLGLVLVEFDPRPMLTQTTALGNNSTKGGTDVSKVQVQLTLPLAVASTSLPVMGLTLPKFTSLRLAVQLSACAAPHMQSINAMNGALIQFSP